MNTEIFKIYVVKKLVFLGGDLEYELDWFLRKFPRSSKRTIVCDVSICTPCF